MANDSENNGRLWRRAAGLGAFGAFCCGILLTFGLVRLLLLALALAVLVGLLAAVLWLVVSYRDALARHVVRVYRASVPAADRVWRVSRLLVARSSKSGMQAARTVARQMGPAVRTLRKQLRLIAAKTAEGARELLDRGVPAARRAQRSALVRLQAASASGSRHVSRAAAVVAADVAAHRKRARARVRTSETPPRPRRGDLPPRQAASGWQRESIGEDVLDAHDDVEPQREARRTPSMHA